MAMFVSIRQSAAVKKSEYFEMFITYIQHVVLKYNKPYNEPIDVSQFLSAWFSTVHRSIGMGFVSVQGDMTIMSFVGATVGAGEVRF